MGGRQVNDEVDMARLGKVPVLKVRGSRSISTLETISV